MRYSLTSCRARKPLLSAHSWCVEMGSRRKCKCHALHTMTNQILATNFTPVAELLYTLNAYTVTMQSAPDEMSEGCYSKASFH